MNDNLWNNTLCESCVYYSTTLLNKVVCLLHFGALLSRRKQFNVCHFIGVHDSVCVAQPSIDFQSRIKLAEIIKLMLGGDCYSVLLKRRVTNNINVVLSIMLENNCEKPRIFSYRRCSFFTFDSLETYFHIIRELHWPTVFGAKYLCMLALLSELIFRAIIRCHNEYPMVTNNFLAQLRLFGEKF